MISSSYGKRFVSRNLVSMISRELAMLYAYYVSRECTELDSKVKAQRVLEELDSRDPVKMFAKSPVQICFDFEDSKGCA